MADAPYERYDRLQLTTLDEYANEVGRGNIRGGYREWAYGLLTSATGVTRAIIRDQGGTTLYVPPVSGLQASVVSSSTNDTLAGTGVQKVIIEYLDGNLVSKIEVVTLDGTTPVLTIATDIRWVQSVYIYQSGSGKVAAGNIDVIINANIMVRISTGSAISKSSLRRIPAGKHCLIGCMMAGSNSGTAAARTLVEFFTTDVDGTDMTQNGIGFAQLGFSLQDNTSDITLSYPAIVGPGVIVGFYVTSDKAFTTSVKWMGAVERHDVDN